MAAVVVRVDLSAKRHADAVAGSGKLGRLVQLELYAGTLSIADLTPAARKTFVASFLGWTLDAFDFFLLTFVINRIAGDLKSGIIEVTGAITLTLACRPAGALLFGWIADRYGRRVPLMIDIAFYSVVELLTAFSPNFTVFLVLRALYGVAMGGEWGLGAAMAMEALPAQRRGFFSGLLQEGYMVGYLLAAAAYFLVFHFAPLAGLAKYDWRILFVIGVLPSLLIFYIRAHVPESPAWLARRTAGVVTLSPLRYLPLFVYTILLMAAMNFMSHGTQDLYATFLQKQHGFLPGTVSTLSIVAALGAIAGGIVFGAVSQRIGRRRAMLACAVLGAAFVPLWAYSHTIALLGAGAFAIQFAVQGAWGVIPSHLNELSPAGARGTFPGFTYQLGNLISAGAAQLEAAFAFRHYPLPGGSADFGKAMAIIALAMFAAVFVLTALGYFVSEENRDAAFVPDSP
ncbi:MAG: MFS transporter [Candidatus Eremiobacteraeota bacterium]|nr:MFS transporter [Candidatus Eremiobacteraeota bacterium]